MNKFKFAVLGTSTYVLSCAQAIIDAGHEIVVFGSIPLDSQPLNSADVSAFAAQINSDYFECSDINHPEIVTLLKSYNVDYIFCSWPRLLKEEVLSIPKYYCIGSHPTELPLNRGRHPLHWLIVLGSKGSALTFFIMDKGVDSGEILLQKHFTIEPNIGIAVLNDLVNLVGYEGMLHICNNVIQQPKVALQKQDNSIATYWRKRGFFDCIIDPRMSVDAIMRLVRSYAPPYPCASLIVSEHQALKVKAAYFAKDYDLEFIKYKEPGLVIRVDGSRLTIKVDDGVVTLDILDNSDVELQNLKYIYPPMRYNGKINIG